VANVRTVGVAGYKQRLQYTVGQTVWTESGLEITAFTSTGFKTTSWADIPKSLRGDEEWLRIVGSGGDAVADPEAQMVVELK